MYYVEELVAFYIQYEYAGLPAWYFFSFIINALRKFGLYPNSRADEDITDTDFNNQANRMKTAPRFSSLAHGGCESPTNWCSCFFYTKGGLDLFQRPCKNSRRYWEQRPSVSSDQFTLCLVV